MINKGILIGIAGFARSGKDTMARLLENQLTSLGIEVRKFSFAKKLKSDLDDFCIDKFNISAFEEDSCKKEKIRPLLIAYGSCQRKATSGKYWFEKIKPDIDSFLNSESLRVAIVTDVRFKQYEFDEYDFIRSYKKNFLVALSRTNIGPANEDENSNFPFFASNSDARIEWTSSNDLEYLNKIIKPCTEAIINKLQD